MTRHINVDQTGTELFTTANPGKVLQTGSNVTDGQTLWTPGMLFNETTSDRPRGNTQGTLLALAARTATTSSPTIINYNARGVNIELTINTASGTGGLQVFLGMLSATGTFYNLTAPFPSAAITTTGKNIFTFYPGIQTAVEAMVTQRQSIELPRQFYIVVQHVNATSYTYEVTYSLTL